MTLDTVKGVIKRKEDKSQVSAESPERNNGCPFNEAYAFITMGTAQGSAACNYTRTLISLSKRSQMLRLWRRA